MEGVQDFVSSLLINLMDVSLRIKGTGALCHRT